MLQLSSRDAESCLLGRHSAESLALVACQVIPPHGAFLGITVFAYLQSLMQANSYSDCSPKAGCQWQQKDSLVSSFNHTLPLCQNSISESSSDGSTLPHPWHSVSDLVLCFSPEETRECSLLEGSVDDESQKSFVLQGSNEVQGAKFGPFMPSESEHQDHNRLPTLHEPLVNFSSMSPIKTTTYDHVLESLGSFHQWASKDCLSQLNASLREKPSFNPTSFTLEDAPLSKTLGEFLNTQPQFVNKKELGSTSKRDQARPDNNVPLENGTVRHSYTSEAQPLDSSLFTPLRDVTNNKNSVGGKIRKRKTSLVSKCTTKLLHVSKELLSCDIKGVVSKTNGGASVHNHATEQLSQLSGYEDAYDCSADLFHQSSMTESSVSDFVPKKQDRLADISVSEPNVSSFHFAPSLQSTPIVHPSIQCTYGQRRKLSKKWSGLHWSRKIMTHASHIRVLQNHTPKNRRRLQLVKAEFNQSCCDSALETSQSSAGDCELKADMKHTPGDSALHATTIDCSRDLFDPFF